MMVQSEDTNARSARTEAKATFTPGPWHANIARRSDDGILAAHVVGSDGGNIAQIAIYEAHEGVSTEANARLIAAAPDLLAKCQKIVAWLDRLIAALDAGAKDQRFITLKEAQEADARNFRAIRADILRAIAKAGGAA